ncbi:MAG: aldehyde ferredoxin oxidoreductase C-terminal domain-containing protein [Candidatus Lokiarchaeota archaeon]
MRARVPKHVDYYAEYFSAITGRESKPEDLIRMSERVYNFQRILAIRQGKGLKEQDSNFPYRGMGPVTELEYESRSKRYDKELKEEIGIDPEGKSTKEKVEILRKHREKRYDKLQEVVYKERGWNQNGCPTVEKVKQLGLDYDESV